MSENNRTAAPGNIKISEDVVASVAFVAASEVKGVKIAAPKKPEALARMARRHVRMKFAGAGIVLDVALVVKYGFVIPEVAEAVQERIIDNVESLTGLTVEAVNIRCSGIIFPKNGESAKGK